MPTQDRLADLTSPGSYALVFRCRAAVTVPVGALGPIAIRKGFLLYVGSAFGPGGIAGRLAHHRRPIRRPRWHVDYLRPFVELTGAWWTAGDRDVEHRWASVLTELPGFTAPAPGFGASDCSCASHLFACASGARGQRVREGLAGSCAPAELRFVRLREESR